MEMPSLALRTAWSRPRICDVMRLAIARPAESSAAELMRLPVESCSMADVSARLLTFRACWATRALVLVLITDMDLS